MVLVHWDELLPRANPQQELWRAAAEACAALAAALAAGEEDAAQAAVDELDGALDDLSRAPCSEPTADFLREAAAAATAIASLAAGAKTAKLPADQEGLLRQLECWSSACGAATTLARAVLNGSLGWLPVREAYQLCSGVLAVTDGLPTLLLAVQPQWAWNSLQLSALPAAAIRMAGNTCMLATRLLALLDRCISSGSGAGPAGGEAAAVPTAVTKLLRSTAVRPALVLSALDALTLVVPPNVPIGWVAPRDRTDVAASDWLALAKEVCSLPMCYDEQARLGDMPSLLLMATLAVEYTRHTLLPASKVQGAPSERWCADVDSAAMVLGNPHVLHHSLPALGLLGDADTAQLVPTALNSLRAALAEEPASQSAGAAQRALPLAVFATSCMAATGAAASMALLGQRGTDASRAPAAVLQLSRSKQEQLQVQMLLQALGLVPAVLAAIDAVLRHKMWPPAAGQAADPAAMLPSSAMLRLSGFFAWLGAGLQAAPMQVAAGLETAAAAGIAAVAQAWLLLQYRLLQLCAYQPASARVGCFNSAAAIGSEASGVNILQRSLAHCSRGMAKLLDCFVTVLGARQSSSNQVRDEAAEMAAAVASASASAVDAAAAMAAGQHPALPIVPQLVSAVSIVAHVAADAHCCLSSDREAAQQLAHVLLDCPPGGAPVFQAAEQLYYAVTGLQVCFQEADDNQPAEALGRHLGLPLLEAAAAATALLHTLSGMPEAAAAPNGSAQAAGRLSEALKDLSLAMACAAFFARACKQSAVATAAERALGGALKLLAALPTDASHVVEVWRLIANLLLRAGFELVASGAVAASLERAKQLAAAGSAEATVVIKGVHKALLLALREVEQLPQRNVPGAGGAALMAAARRHAGQQLGLSGVAAQLAAYALAQQAIEDGADSGALPADERRRLMAEVHRLGRQGWSLKNTRQMLTAAAELLSRLTPLAQQHVAPGSPAADGLALARCALLSNRRCAHLGCTNLPLLLGLSSNGGQHAASHKCSGCRTVWFCSTACSRADWRVHKQACRQLAAAGGAQEA